MDATSNNNHVKNTMNESLTDDDTIQSNKQVGEEMSSKKTTVDIHTGDPINNGTTLVYTRTPSLHENEEGALKPTKSLPNPSDACQTNKDNKQTLQSARKDDSNQNPSNIPGTNEFDYIDGERSKISPTKTSSDTGRYTHGAPKDDNVAAGGATSSAPANAPLDTIDHSQVRREHTGSRHQAVPENRASAPAPTKKRKSVRRSLSKLISRARGKKTEEQKVVETESAAKISTPAHTPKPVRFDRLQDAFIHYNHDNKIHGKPHGRGLCVIFSLFTGELTGYLEDRKRAFKFFRDLGYEVYCDDKYFINCTKAQLLSSCRKIQAIIEKKARENGGRPHYDRFALIVLTHGEKGGLMTCADPDGFLEEHQQVPKSGGGYHSQRVLTKVEEICDMFKHDCVPALKDKPKLFLIQACRGSDVLRHAGASQTALKEQSFDLTNLNIRPEVPIDADQIVYYATTPEHESWVAKTGSWFIEKTLEVFRRHYKERHVEEMMTVVNLLIANERGQTLLASGAVSEVVQMPCKFSTLRMAFYL